MKKIVVLLLVCCSALTAMAQDMANGLIENAVKKGVVLLRQDFQVLNDDDEPVGNKPGHNCYGRTYTCGIRIEEDKFLVTKDFVAPWANESIVKSEKRHPEVSYSGFMTLSSVDFESIDCDVEDASEEVPNHLYLVEASEVAGFSLDGEAGKKKGYAVWLKSASAFSLDKAPSNLTLEIVPFNITTKENAFVYDIPKQPSGNVVGGVYLVPSIGTIGTIKLKVNGMFEKRGGVWKFISLGKESSNE